MKKRLLEGSILFVSVLKWSLLATIIGIIVGAATSVFLKALNLSISFSNSYDYFFLSMPFVFFLNSFFIYKILPNDNAYSTDKVIENIHIGRSISVASILKAFSLPIMTIASGGSAGKEAPAADIGAGIGSLFGKALRLNKEDIRKLTICGVSAGFSSVFGTPIAGAIFGVEVLFIGSILYDVLLPSFISGIIAYQTSLKLGITYSYTPLNFLPEFSEIFFLKAVASGVFFGMLSFLFVEIVGIAKTLSSKTNIWYPLKGIIGGTILVLLTFVFSKKYLGLGLETIKTSLEGSQIEWYAPFMKIIFTAITLAFCGVGGVITPALFIGSSAGVLFSGFLGTDPSTFSALGLVCVLSGTTNTPIASSIMAIELFGASIAPYASVACVISFLMSGHRSIYPSQVLSIKKSSSIKVEKGSKIKDIHLWFSG